MITTVEHGTEQMLAYTIETTGQSASISHINIVRALLLSPSEGSILVCVGEDGNYRLPGGRYDLPQEELDIDRKYGLIKNACKSILEQHAGVTIADRSDPVDNGTYTVSRKDLITGETVNTEYAETVLAAKIVRTHANDSAKFVWFPLCEADYMIREGETVDHDGNICHHSRPPKEAGQEEKQTGLVFHNSALTALSVLTEVIREKYRPETALALAKISSAIQRSGVYIAPPQTAASEA